MESTDSSAGSPRQQQQPHLPPGFRFHPTDEELVVHYLKKKAASVPLPVTIIAEVDLYKFDPWELPEKASFGDQEWYFFSPRDRKYPNGARPNRAATSGYWKATGTDKPILASVGAQKVGVKKALVFYGGKPPKGIKTNWIMHEYRLADTTPKRHPAAAGLPKGGSLRLDDWVLCRIYKKNNNSTSINNNESQLMRSIESEAMLVAPPPAINNFRANLGGAGNTSTYSALMDTDDTFIEDFLAGDGMPQHYSMTQMVRTKHSNDPSMASKRALAAPFWNDTGGTIPLAPSAKRYNPGGASTSSVTNNHNNNNSSSSNGSTNKNKKNVSTSQTIAMLLNQIPPDTPNYQQLGSLGADDGSTGVFRQQFHLSGLNWTG